MSKQIVDFDQPFTENYKILAAFSTEIKESIMSRCGITKNQFRFYMNGQTEIPKAVNEIANDVIKTALLKIEIKSSQNEPA